MAAAADRLRAHNERLQAVITEVEEQVRAVWVVSNGHCRAGQPGGGAPGDGVRLVEWQRLTCLAGPGG